MADEGDVRVVEDLEEAVRHLRGFLCESGMYAGDDDVHLREYIVREIERPVGENVHFNAGEDLDAIDLLVALANALDMRFGALVIESVCEGEILGMVGDGHVLVTALKGGGGHFFDGALAVGFNGVSVYVSADISLRK